MGVQDLVRKILPREDSFFDLLEKQGVVLQTAARALAEFRPGGQSAEAVAKRVQEIEHDGDALMHAIEETLAKTFVTPIDREDIQHLATRLDDIVDKMNLTARSFALYGVDEPSPAMQKLIDLLVQCTDELSRAVPLLRKNAYAEITEAARRIKTLEKEGDTVFRDAVAKLFRDESVSAKRLIRDKEVLEDLEEAVDFCEDLGETLTHLAVKHG